MNDDTIAGGRFLLENTSEFELNIGSRGRLAATSGLNSRFSDESAAYIFNATIPNYVCT